MKLQSIHTECIWCKKRLIQSGLLVDCDQRFGPRPRSDEHIIPKNLFGKLATVDLCKCCNDNFGLFCDHALVKDDKIVEAAKRAGLEITDLWPQFYGTQMTPKGRKIKISYNKGSFKPKAELQSIDKLAIPIIDGKLNEEDLKHFEARLIQKVKLKKMGLSQIVIEKHVGILLGQMRHDCTKTYTDSVIDETVVPSQLNSQVIYTGETKPWETQWCLAKIVFELSQMLWPKNYRTYFLPVLDQWRFFINARECSPDGKQGIGIFLYDELPVEMAAKRHVFEGIVSATEIRWSLIFFGTARWTFVNFVTPIHAPADGPYRIEIINPVGPEADAKITLSPL
jgi:HNH endonuclease